LQDLGGAFLSTSVVASLVVFLGGLSALRKEICEWFYAGGPRGLEISVSHKRESLEKGEGNRRRWWTLGKKSCQTIA